MNRLAVTSLVFCALVGCASADGPLVFTSDRGSVQRIDVEEPGYVVVRYDVDTDGRVTNAEVVESVPDDRFNTAALAVVNDWVFRAARQDGSAVVTRGVTSRIDFKTGDSDD